MQFSPASHEKALENEDRIRIFFQESSQLAQMLQHQLKGGRLPLSSFSLPVINRTKDHIPLVLLKKGEDLPDVFKSG